MRARLRRTMFVLPARRVAMLQMKHFRIASSSQSTVVLHQVQLRITAAIRYEASATVLLQLRVHFVAALVCRYTRSNH